MRDKSDTLGRVLSNFQLYFTEDQLHLQAFMENATVSSEVEFRESMEKTLRAMELIKSHADSSGADPQFASLVLDVNGYTRLVNEVFAARTQKNWNVSSYLLSTESGAAGPCRQPRTWSGFSPAGSRPWVEMSSGCTSSAM